MLLYATCSKKAIDRYISLLADTESTEWGLGKRHVIMAVMRIPIDGLKVVRRIYMCPLMSAVHENRR